MELIDPPKTFHYAATAVAAMAAVIAIEPFEQ
jgi:hypothetical protein